MRRRYNAFMRLILGLLLASACTTQESTPPNESIDVSWKFHDRVTGVRVLGPDINVSVGDTNVDGITYIRDTWDEIDAMDRLVMNAPPGGHVLHVQENEPPYQSIPDRYIEGDLSLAVDFAVYAIAAPGTIGFAWDVRTPDGVGCGFSLDAIGKIAAVFDADDGVDRRVLAYRWNEDGTAGVPTPLTVPSPYRTYFDFPTGTHAIDVSIVDTRTNITYAKASISAVSVGGYRTVAEPLTLVASNCWPG